MQLAISFTAITCCHDGCGMTFAVPNWWEKNRRDDHTWWYCPNGHSQHFYAKSDAEIAQAERDKAIRQRDRALNNAAQNRQRWKREEGTSRALRGHVTRVKRRVMNGVCPCCKRCFQDWARHMKSKHPNYLNEPLPVGVEHAGCGWYHVKGHKDAVRGRDKALRTMAGIR